MELFCENRLFLLAVHYIRGNTPTNMFIESKCTSVKLNLFDILLVANCMHVKLS